MQTKCPNCGATMSLDAQITSEAASEAIAAAFAVSGKLGKTLMRYCGLFRPAKSQLSFARVATLINQLLPDLQAQRITRNGQVIEAPTEAWIYAMQVMLDRRDDPDSNLALPLKSHGYLYEIIAGYKPEHGVVDDVPRSNASKPLGQVGGLTTYLQGKKR